MNKGFTLIETIIYIALFGLLIGGALVTSYGLIEGTDRSQSKTTIQEEANFVLRKIDWALTGVKDINIPGSEWSNTLSVTKYGPTGLIYVVIRPSSGKIEMSEDGGTNFLPITTENVEVSNLGFYRISGAGPDGISASTTISGFVASTTKYIRQ